MILNLKILLNSFPNPNLQFPDFNPMGLDTNFNSVIDNESFTSVSTNDLSFNNSNPIIQQQMPFVSGFPNTTPTQTVNQNVMQNQIMPSQFSFPPQFPTNYSNQNTNMSPQFNTNYLQNNTQCIYFIFFSFFYFHFFLENVFSRFCYFKRFY